ncbi:MAG: Hsp70 family protein, partial [Desulfovibrio sp.]|nr:Hsp70 family protein [Desulfovibrio sp.]
ASDDKKKQELISARNEADSLIYATEKSLNDLGDKVDAGVKSDIEGKIAELRKVMELEDVEAIRAAIKTLTEASHKIAEQLYKQTSDAQGQGQSAGEKAQGTTQNNNDDVVDADYTEVKK